MLIKVVTDQQRNHVPWLINYIRERELPPIKQTLDECYALLAPVLPGTTLVLSTRRNELVKGTVTRVGTRIVKAVCFLSHLTSLGERYKVQSRSTWIRLTLSPPLP